MDEEIDEIICSMDNITIDSFILDKIIEYDFYQLSFMYNFIINNPISFEFSIEASPELEQYIDSYTIKKLENYLIKNDPKYLLSKSINKYFPELFIEEDIISELLNCYFEHIKLCC